jgi:outer membrane lipoprotein-sorting protein
MPPRWPSMASLFLAFTMLSSCLVRRHEVAPATARQNRPLLTATKEELIQRIRDVSDPIQSFLMKADLSPSVTHPSEQAVTEYATIGVYILFRRPDQIRVIGQDPVLHSTIFDMVSSGKEFRVYIPPKNRFIVGDNAAPGTSKNKLENLRPTAFLTSLMIYQPDMATDVTLLENDTDQSNPVYVLLIARRDQDQFTLSRNIYFDHYTLQITRQKTFDASGNVVGDTKYSNWKPYNGISFPSEIDIQRPQDNYEVELSLTSMEVNTPQVTSDKFVLNQPQGAELEQLK